MLYNAKNQKNTICLCFAYNAGRITGTFLGEKPTEQQQILGSKTIIQHPFQLRHSTLIFIPMITHSDLPNAAIDHVSSMLTLAKQKHQEAMAMIGTPDANAIPRLRKALQLLDEVELLAEDATSYVESDAMVAALKELQQQQASIQRAIERLEQLSKHSLWVSPWPWIVVMAVFVAVLVSISSP